MSKVLYIKANAKAEGESRTFKISDRFIEVYKENNPDDEIVVLDLYDAKVPFLPKGELAEMRQAVINQDRNHPVLKFAYDFIDADKYVISEPIWNLGIPAILKAYVDCIAIGGITFAYTDHGPVGLCKGKKAINIITRGGDYSFDPMESLEMADKYLCNIFKFMGITDYTTFATDRLDIITEDTQLILQNALQNVTKLALSF
jgi:FMN-dependent NADH-azoreductase